ncbi:MAG: sulfatase [Planctomycetota bacterium]
MESTNSACEHVENVILISFDSLRSDYVAKISSAEAPNLCLMRDRGAFFRNAIVQAPLTIPSHASLFSGLYPAKTGVRDMHHKMSPVVPTVFSILNERGFCTMASSPMAMFRDRLGPGGLDKNVPFRYRPLKKSITALDGKRFFAFLHYWGTHTPYETRLPGYNPVDVLLNLLRPADRLQSIRYLRRIGDALWLSRIERIRKMVKEGHSQILPALRSGYKRAIVTADKFLAGVLNILKEGNLADKTLIVLTGDHGDSFNEHGEIDTAVGGRYEHGQFLYENIIKVPLVFFCPGQGLSQAFEAQVQQVDIVPTLLDALGVETDLDMDGRSLWSEHIVKGIAPEEDYTFSEVVRESLEMELRCVRTNSHKLIYNFNDNTYELYDLQVDPEEKAVLPADQQCDEKAILLDTLTAFAESRSIEGASYTVEERQEVENTLRNLGYMD